MTTLFLKKGEDRRVRLGHMWIFSNEIDVKRSPLTELEHGQAVEISDAGGRILGTGYVNPSSLIAVRMVSRRAGRPLDADLLRSRLASALALRQCLFSRPFYRLCHGEGDFLPGLVADRHGDHVVCQITTAGMEARTDDLLQILEDLLHPESVFLDNDVASRDLEGLERFQKKAFGLVPEEITVEENGVSYVAPLLGGQKTGWFYDQRMNRAACAGLVSKGYSVLDAFCYAGGFGALAARNGAQSVTFLDASATALSFAKRNCEALSSAEAELLKGDASELLSELRRQGRTFDMVCLDPPAFIKRKKDVKHGLEAYARANANALALVRPGGFLMTCSCSHHLEEESLRSIVTHALVKSGRSGKLLFRGHQGSDHPIHPAMPETAYLTTFLFQIIGEGKK